MLIYYNILYIYIPFGVEVLQGIQGWGGWGGVGMMTFLALDTCEMLATQLMGWGWVGKTYGV